MPDSPRTIVRNALPAKMADEIWTGNYDKVLPITMQEFAMSAILPAVFYMFRFGDRRGKGLFLKTFAPGDGPRPSTTIERIATMLAGSDDLCGFDDDVTKAILGDLLLCFGLENIRHELGRDKQIQRVAPTHYMTSWIDLPDSVAHLRGIPEMIVGTLANQKKGDHIKATDKGLFPVASSYDENPLLAAFSQGVTREGMAKNRKGDRFDETDDKVGIDQLIMIRLAQRLGEAPAGGGGKNGKMIPNQHPIANLAARHFAEDIRRFIRSYAPEVPRLTLLEMLESCMAVGLTSIFTSTVQLLFKWLEEGEIPTANDQHPARLFVDCSMGVRNDLRMLSEQSLDDWVRQMERLPTVLMMLRTLDYLARNDGKVKKLGIEQGPHARDWVNLLGCILHERHPSSGFIHQRLEGYSNALAEELHPDYDDIADILQDDVSEPNVVRRISAAVTQMRGRSVHTKLLGLLDSMLHVNRPNGLAQKRGTTRGTGAAGGARRRRDVRSLVFSDAVLDYLVHVHILAGGNKAGIRRLSVNGFLAELRDRYGFFVDEAPGELSVSNELLQLNRSMLERRLRDLGLLVGVNDAESMKRLRPRFRPAAPRRKSEDG